MICTLVNIAMTQSEYNKICNGSPIILVCSRSNNIPCDVMSEVISLKSAVFYLKKSKLNEQFVFYDNTT